MKRAFGLFEAVTLIIGMSIGAGVLGIPYAAAQVGFLPAVCLMIGLGVINVILQLMFAEVIVKTPSLHQVPGYCGIYIGKWAQRLTLTSSIISGYGALLAYMIGEGQVLSTLFGGSDFFWSLLFFATASVIFYIGLGVIKVFEAWLTSALCVVVGIIALKAFPFLNTSNFEYMSLDKIGLPYGVFLFSLVATAIIPQLKQVLAHRQHDIPKAILIANGVILTVYLVFMTVVLGVTGLATTEIATLGLGQAIGPFMTKLGSILAFFTLTTSCLTLGLAKRSMFQFDYGMSKNKAWLLTVTVPIVFFLLGLRDFIAVVAIVGGLLLSIQSAMVVWVYWKVYDKSLAKQTFEYGKMKLVGSVLIVIFGIGGLVTLLTSLL